MTAPCPYCEKKLLDFLDGQEVKQDAASFRCECPYCGWMFDVEVIIYKLDEEER